MFRRKSLCVVTLALISAACSDEAGNSGDPKVALSINNLEPGEPCAEGGKEILFGADVDGNGVLDEVEVEGSTLLCNGADGQVGAKGDKGDRGAAGATGATGPAGRAGDAGAEGEAGAKGEAGDPGIAGEIGPQGVQGDAGAPGTQGATGAQGPQGDVGTPGATGAEGAPGSQGAQGLQGDAGAPGEQGPQGIQGVQGIQGIQGTQGETGASGPQGDAGPPGEQGMQGVPGAAGSQGVQGVQGDAGAQGLQGIQGVQGIQGDPGAAGSQGIQGVQGDAGVRGFNSLILLTVEPAGAHCQYGGTLIQVGSDNGQGVSTAYDGVLSAGEVDSSAYVCSGAALPPFDVDLGTANLTWDSHSVYSGDDETLACNNRGTTLDLTYRWTASSTGCVFFNARVSGSGGHPFFSIRDAVTGASLSCTQGGTDYNVVSGTTYLLTAEPYTLGDDLGGIEVNNFCF